ncbi:transcriptional regulator GcvA [Pasteurellaceae bacterium TAE3-ERU1]|uniref:transcriptional regulator GcvA n=1 Tax=Spirabiliibacterium mucosae TaxID=28156 RepID=UPI001AAD4730|nr:transcriptional regulator GcvA [Spirabiliibacterium mucosae]MBE2898202.1 transcriptional regulator GcvA [Spirabiliibacterium mucosae]MBV7387646.1 transcriptional regulator GcvA [Pasteurellaceae bacterium TAE3-ERU1]
MQNKNLPPLNALKAFEASARLLSFTKAADELFVTQAAISHQIKLLEDYLGLALFVRKNRTLVLTDEGSAYYYDVRAALQRLAQATRKLKNQRSSEHLTIKVPQTFGMAWLVPHLGEFNALHPQIEVAIQGVDYDESAVITDADVAIFYGRGNWAGLDSHQLFSGKLSILASPNLLAQKPLESVEALKNHNLLHIHNRENWQSMVNHLGLEDVDIAHGVVFSHTFMALQAAVHGQGVVLANTILAQKYITEGLLSEVFLTDVTDPKSFYVVYHSDNKDKAPVVAFVDWISQHSQ